MLYVVYMLYVIFLGTNIWLGQLDFNKDVLGVLKRIGSVLAA